MRDVRHEVTPPRPVGGPRASPAGAAAALASFVDGVEQRDAAALTRLAPPGVPAAEALLSAVATNARSLVLTEVGARYVRQRGSVAADGSWTGVAELTWRVRGYDEAPARAEVLVRFAPDGARLGIAGFGGEAGGGVRLPLWLRAKLSVTSSPGVLVMAEGSRGEAEVVRERAERGIEVVRRVLPEWSAPVVVEVPASGADLDEALGAEPGTYAGIAAVTAAVGDSWDERGPVHVFVNPDVTAGVGRGGAQAVMSHELVHVATDAVRRPVEPWLLEGFADYVTLRDTQLPDRVALGRAIAVARREGVREALPTAADFDARGRDLQARYEEAWLACRIVAERLGERGLVELYDEVSGGSTPARALAEQGLSRDDLTTLWQDRLARVAG
ncbi:hypothetical protein [Nocardioides sp. zg-1228]|uniref:hypothetical protein n=1 Tax=Nocardioides sp. zg-1228 TaxID=2763008 RepID=UPI0016428AB3|nr:hypothetical protein [Nocardioides sp. zg-1228]MBC2933470.1 hypothetical protein [Nocardioides sp. zg-1228]QSF56390.1 hypothetical protein JX575_12075 [Nocardioides sp. zg-1228]